jgi:hypothetical protein
MEHRKLNMIFGNFFQSYWRYTYVNLELLSVSTQKFNQMIEKSKYVQKILKLPEDNLNVFFLHVKNVFRVYKIIIFLVTS